MAVEIDRFLAYLGIDWDPTPEQQLQVEIALAGAVATVEKLAQTVLDERAVTQRLDRFVDSHGSSLIRLRYAPVVSVEGIDYLDPDGVAASLAVDDDFRLISGLPAMLLPPIDGSWPDHLNGPGLITVRYTAGYGGSGPSAAGDCPGDLEAAVYQLGAFRYSNREAAGEAVEETPYSVRQACMFYRRSLIG